MTPRVQLFDYQLEALNKLRNGSILWADTGSGKSLTAIGYYYITVCKNMTAPRDLYIITTAKKRDDYEWEGECGKYGIFTDKELNPGKISLHVDSWNNVGKYTSISGAFVIFDEQRVGGSGKWSESFIKISKKNEWILLTATPGDNWLNYMSVFIANGFFRNKTEFKRNHVVYETWRGYPQVAGYCDERMLNKYRNQILVGMKYAKRTEQHHEKLYADYDQQKYSEAMRKQWNPFKNEPVKQASELCYVLRHIVNGDKSRIGIIKELLLKHAKVIIFYNYDYELDLLKSNIDVPIAEWNGHRHEMIPDTNRWAYLVNYAAGAEGWNCTDTNAMIFFSESYSYKAMVQAAGRIDRVNTAYTDLYYYHIVTRAKIDLAIARALNEKRNFNESAFCYSFRHA